MYIHEKQGGRRRHDALLDGFKIVVNECNLRDFGFTGSEFT